MATSAMPGLFNAEGMTRRQNLLSGFDVWRYMQFLLVLLYWVAGFFALTVVVFLRRDFGERYLSWLNLIAAYQAVWFLGFFGALSGGTSAALAGLFYLGFLGASIFHRVVIARRNKAVERGEAEPWHSLYSGTSHFETLPALGQVKRRTINTLIEPAAILALGFLLGTVSRTLGLWLFFCAFSVMLREVIEYYHLRQYLLDQQDAQIEARNLHAAMSGRPASETQGVHFDKSNAALLRNVATVAAIPAGDDHAPPPLVAEALPDDFAGLLDTPGAASAKPRTPEPAPVSNPVPASPPEADEWDRLLDSPPPPKEQNEADRDAVDPDEPWSTYKPPT